MHLVHSQFYGIKKSLKIKKKNKLNCPFLLLSYYLVNTFKFFDRLNFLPLGVGLVLYSELPILVAAILDQLLLLLRLPDCLSQGISLTSELEIYEDIFITEYGFFISTIVDADGFTSCFTVELLSIMVISSSLL